MARGNHPIALLFFIAFRLGALLTYLLGSIFTDNFTLIFVITILLLAFDFWTVKNVSGRILVGLRWWNEIQEDGTNKWVFESANPNRAGNANDSRLFWTVLYATPVLWILLAFTCIFTFKFAWLVIVVVAIILNLANVYGYTQCFQMMTTVLLKTAFYLAGRMRVPPLYLMPHETSDIQ
ncbi:hypothetical protein BC943DRAFT_341819 [Umbelopsis sp. AD052]|nr:hypothetical protein BC943DRAFT_341819 [Umbelopsis sp. AD052]